MLERKELFILNGVEIDLDLVDGRYYSVTLSDGRTYVFQYLQSEIDTESVTTASKVVDLDKNILCVVQHEHEELKVADNSRIENISELPKAVGEYITSEQFWKTVDKATVSVNGDSINIDESNFTPQNFIEAMFAKQKGMI